MADMKDDKKDKQGAEMEEVRKIRMTLTSRLVKPLEAACGEVIARAKHQAYKTKGPNRMPTKCLTVTTRRSPCGNGTNTWDRYEMKIHKRVLDIYCPSSIIREITNFRIDAAVQVNLVVWDDDRTNQEAA